MSEIVSTPVSSPAAPVSIPEVAVVTAAPSAPIEQAKPDTPADDQRMGRKFAELTRRQRDLVQREQAMKDQATKVEPLSRAIEEARASKNPAKILAAAGFSLDDVIEFYAQGGEDAVEATPEKSVEDMVDERLAKKQQEEAGARYDQQITDFKASIKETAAADQDAFELVNKFEQHDVVYDVILAHHTQSGEVLSVTDALALVEQHLFSQISGLKKTQPKPQASPQSREPRTQFTLSQSQAAPMPPAQTKLTPQQAKDRAVSMLRFNN